MNDKLVRTCQNYRLNTNFKSNEQNKIVAQLRLYRRCKICLFSASFPAHAVDSMNIHADSMTILWRVYRDSIQPVSAFSRMEKTETEKLSRAHDILEA